MLRHVFSLFSHIIHAHSYRTLNIRISLPPAFHTSDRDRTLHLAIGHLPPARRGCLASRRPWMEGRRNPRIRWLGRWHDAAVDLRTAKPPISVAHVDRGYRSQWARRPRLCPSPHSPVDPQSQGASLRRFSLVIARSQNLRARVGAISDHHSAIALSKFESQS
jgi:hypothetical protein